MPLNIFLIFRVALGGNSVRFEEASSLNGGAIDGVGGTAEAIILFEYYLNITFLSNTSTNLQ